MFWTKKKEQDTNRKTPIEKVEFIKENSVKVSNLRITFTDAYALIWTCETDELLGPWLQFKKWFHCRPQSEFFTLITGTLITGTGKLVIKGETTIKRSTIKYYEIFLKEEK